MVRIILPMVFLFLSSVVFANNPTSAPFIYNMSRVPLTVKNSVAGKSAVTFAHPGQKIPGLKPMPGVITVPSMTIALFGSLFGQGNFYYYDAREPAGGTINNAWTGPLTIIYKNTPVTIDKNGYWIFNDAGVFYAQAPTFQNNIYSNPNGFVGYIPGNGTEIQIGPY